MTGGNQDGTLDVATAAQNGINKSNDNEIFILTGTTEDDLDDLSDIVTAVGNTNFAANDEFFLVVNNAAGSQAGFYFIDGGGANTNATLTTAEIAFVGLINTDAALVAGDFTLGT